MIIKEDFIRADDPRCKESTWVRHVSSKVRIELAVKYLKQGYSLEELADELGYKTEGSLRASLRNQRSILVSDIAEVQDEFTPEEEESSKWNKILYSKQLGEIK